MSDELVASALDDYLHEVDRMVRENRNHEGWTYQTYEGLILDKGQHYTEVEYQRFGDYKMCFANSWLASAATGWDYVEGYAWSAGLIPVLHAWCVDETGRVIETTWDFRVTLYRGLVIPTHVMIESMMDTGKTGLLAGDWERGFPLLREGATWL